MPAKRDVVDELVDERSQGNADFPELVEGALRRRQLPRRLPQPTFVVPGPPGMTEGMKKTPVEPESLRSTPTPSATAATNEPSSPVVQEVTAWPNTPSARVRSGFARGRSFSKARKS
jgi:hypothetical protein